MKFSEINGLSLKDLKSKAKDLQAQLFEASVKNKIGQLSNPLVIRFMRKDLARIKTAMASKGKG